MKEVVLNFKINNIDQAEQLGNNLEKAAKGVADLVGGIALLGAGGKTIEEMQKNFAQIIGITQAVKGGIEAVSASIKLMGGPLTLIIGLIGAAITAIMYFTSNADDIEALKEANDNLNDSFEKTIELMEINNKLVSNGIESRIKMAQLNEDAVGVAEAELSRAKENIINNDQLIKKLEEQHKAKLKIIKDLEEEGADNEEINKIRDEAYEIDVKRVTALNEFGSLNDEVIYSTRKLAKVQKEESEKAAEDEAKALEERKRKWEEYQNFRIQAARQIRDLEISLIENVEEAEVAQINERYNRIIEDTKRNEKLLQAEKDKIIMLAEQNRAQDLADIEKKKQDELLKIERDAAIKAKQISDNELNELEAANEQAFQMTRTAQEREITAVQDKFFRLIELAKQHGEDTTALEAEQARQISEIKDKFSKEDEEKLKESRQRTIDILTSSFSAFADITSEIGSLLDQSTEQRTNTLNKEEEKRNDNLRISKEQGLLTEEQYAQQSYAIEQEFIKKRNELAKKAFRRNKVFQIGNAVMQTAQAVTGALAQPPFTPANIIQAAAAGILGAVQIAKIASQKFEGESEGIGAPTGSGVGGGAGSFQPQPTFNPNLTGTGDQSSQTISASNNVIRAYVVEQDITSSQTRMRHIQERASI